MWMARMTVAPVFAMPDGDRFRLELEPRLESWNKHDHPDQVRLRAFVTHVRELIDQPAEDLEGPLAFRLHVGLDELVDPLWQRDLDNYLFPIARRMPKRYVSFWGTKSRGADSFVCVESARATPAPPWPSCAIRRSSGSENAWKRAVRDAVADGEPIEPGPVGMQISLTIGPGRSWTAMWKRTIDGLDAMLGRTYPHKDWNPQDGRIVRLGLHARIDQRLGHDAEAVLWARPADRGWPEVDWLAAMGDDERAAYMDQHAMTIHKAAGVGTGPAGRAAGTTGLRRRSRGSDGDRRLSAAGIVEIKSQKGLRGAVAAGELLVNTDVAGPPKLHIQPGRCRGITEENFRTKVIDGGGKNGRYYTAVDPVAAKKCWPRLQLCGLCRQLDPKLAAEVGTALAGEDARPVDA